jgi:hypothetical protein
VSPRSHRARAFICLAIGSGVLGFIGCGAQSRGKQESAPSLRVNSSSKGESRTAPLTMAGRSRSLRGAKGAPTGTSGSPGGKSNHRPFHVPKYCQQPPVAPQIQAHVFPKKAVLVRYELPGKAISSRCPVTSLHIAVAVGEATRFRSLPPVAIAAPVGVVNVPDKTGGAIRLRVAAENAGRIQGHPIIRWLHQ